VGYNFAAVDREQLLLMPPSVADWLPEDHLAWFVLDVVAELDLAEFLKSYRADGRGGAAYDPAMMLGVLVYAYSVGERSSRRIEQRLVEDVAFRVLAANQVPDHATIARFRATHQDAIAGLFAQVLAVCARAGVLRVELLALDGTKLAANASRNANRTAEQIAKQILAEAEETDAAEDTAAETVESPDGSHPPGDGLSGRGAARQARLRELLEDLKREAAEKSYEAHLARRAEIEAETGRPIRGRKPSPDSARHKARQHVNVTDPDSRLLKTTEGYLQGYNLQAVATGQQFVVAAVAFNRAFDGPLFAPMIADAQRNLCSIGAVPQGRPKVLADAGYWSVENAHHPDVEAFIAPGRARELKAISQADRDRTTVLDDVESGAISKDQAAERLGVTRARVNVLLKRRRDGTPQLTTQMMAKLDTTDGRSLYRQRSASIEPVFAQIKHNRSIRSLSRRGITAADSEWKLICATHNLLKLWRTR
jgi:transposase/plasmid maintenance system antidote protein VapI